MKSLLRKHPLWLIFLLGMLLRCGTAVGLQFYLEHYGDRSFLIEGDANGYWELGEKIAAGEPYSLHEPPRYVLRMPGFPIVLATAVQLGSGSILCARILLAFIGALCIPFTYLLAKQLYGDRVGVWAALGVAIYPMMIGFSVLILSETCFSAALLLSLWSMNLLRNQSLESTKATFLYSLLAGVMVAMAVYMRPVWILFPGLFCFVWVCQTRFSKKTIYFSLVSTGMLFVCLLPWAWRNHQMTGHWVFTSLWAGPSLYDGLHSDATGKSDMRFYDAQRLWETHSEYEIDQHYKQEAFQFLLEHPAQSAKLALTKQSQYWRPWLVAGELSSAWCLWILAPCFAILVGLAVYAIRISGFQLWPLFFTLGPLFYFAVIHLFFVGSPRYRLPAEYPLMILAAYGINVLFKQFKGGGSLKSVRGIRLNAN